MFTASSLDESSATSVPPPVTNCRSMSTPFGAEAADVLGRHGARRMPGDQPLGALVRDHDGVEACPQVAAPDVGVGDVLERELVLLEQPARPAFVDALDPRLVEGNARLRPSGCASCGGLAADAVARKPRSRATASTASRTPLASVTTSAPGLVGVTLDRHRRCQPRHPGAGLEQAIDGEARAVAAPVDHVEGRPCACHPTLAPARSIARSRRVVGGGSKY